MVVLFLLARYLAGSKAGLLAAGFYAFNPGPIVVASLWDQWDAISTCAALLALWLFLRKRYELTAVAITYAALVKPQFAILGALFAVAYAHRRLRPVVANAWNHRESHTALGGLIAPCTRALTSVLSAWVAAEAILLPFNVSIPPLSAQFDLR